MVADLRNEKKKQALNGYFRNFPFFACFSKFKASYGRNIRLWHDIWVNQDPLKDYFSDMHAVSFKKEPNVFDSWHDNYQVCGYGLK